MALIELHIGLCYNGFRIITIIRKFHNAHFSTVIAVFFVLGTVAVSLLGTNKSDGPQFRAQAVFGGPNQLALAEDLASRTASLESSYPIDDFPIATQGADQVVGFAVVEGSAVLNSNNPLSNILPSRDGLLIYKVQKGDTLSKIAANFGISLNTILWANQRLRGNSLSPGEEIVILPISGVLHEIRDGETTETIALLYGIPKEKILEANPRADSGVVAGEKIIVPGAKPKNGLAAAPSANLPNLNGYFALPTTGWNWGQLHPVNAVDVANACGTPVYASAEGLVTRTGIPLSWNAGYGGLVQIDHPNGTVTRYAHLSRIFVSVGDYVDQKEVIAEIGNTGNVHGPSGCHLHFEVGGAKNPLAR